MPVRRFKLGTAASISGALSIAFTSICRAFSSLMSSIDEDNSLSLGASSRGVEHFQHVSNCDSTICPQFKQFQPGRGLDKLARLANCASNSLARSKFLSSTNTQGAEFGVNEMNVS